MSLILNIDTALDTAGVSIARDGVIISSLTNATQKDHAIFLHDAIKNIATSAGINLNALDAIAVTEGPGSYTGLRVGMATAKGLCYALQKPLLTVGTLKAMAYAAKNLVMETGWLYCPMIDARRQEVYTAIYTYNGEVVLPPTAMILDENSFSKWLHAHTMVFFGNGSLKWKLICGTQGAKYIDQLHIIHAVAQVSFEQFRNNEMADLVYAEPLYVKEFYSP